LADTAHWLTEDWLNRFSACVESMTEVRPSLMRGGPIAAGAADVPSGGLWLSLPLDVAPGAAALVGLPAETWQALGKSAQIAAGVDDVTADEARGACLEIVSQATSGLAQSIAARLGRPVASLAPRQIALSGAALAETPGVVPIEISLRDARLGNLFLGFNRSLEAALPANNAETGGAMTVQPVQPERSKTYDLLMEVELPVSVSFGRAQLALRDVLKLNSGSIVELNRTIADPVEIIVNNCVIARGEVVVVEGNYGVRIQHVISREERLRTLK
jgi:flagellar motor switch protein FliN/FliY